MKIWKELAETYNLRYRPGTFFNTGTQITGIYKGHSLKLSFPEDTIQINMSARKQTTENKAITSTNAVDQDWIENQLLSISIRGTITITARGHTIYYRQTDQELFSWQLEGLLDALCQLQERYADILATGGKIAPVLHPIAEDKTHPLRHVALRLLKDIGAETKFKYRHRITEILCPECLTQFSAHHLKLTWFVNPGVTIYYGCRVCSQSQEFIEETPILVLDRAMTEPQIFTADTLRVNWLLARRLIDCDQIEIIEASDEEVERFVVQLGNNTDPLRERLFKMVPVILSASCHLSANTHQMLERVFVDNLSLRS